MSYSSDIKHSMCRTEPETNCCRKAYLNGFLITSATHTERQVTIRLSGSDVLKVFLSLLDRVLHTTWEVTPCRGGGETYEISFTSSSASRYLEEIKNCTDAKALKEASFRCEDCDTWFLRGLFLSSGSVSDPSKSLRLDITPRVNTALIGCYLTDADLAPLSAVRRGKSILYYRSGEPIAYFFAAMGETDIYFSLQNEYFKRELSNLTNRQNNCMVSNIMRSVQHGGELIDVLLRMKERNMLSILPDDLRVTAELRLAYPDYTLPQLAAISVPPLTKSGLNHRLNRILEIARKLDF